MNNKLDAPEIRMISVVCGAGATCEHIPVGMGRAKKGESFFFFFLNTPKKNNKN